MEPKKKTGTLRALLLTLSAFAMLLAGVFVATSASATPEASNGCPEDFALAADGSSCFQLAQDQTTTTAPKCAEGTLTPSGTHCFLPAKVTPQTRTDVVANTPTTTYSCPAGSSASGGSGASLQCAEAGTAQESAANIPNTTYSCPAGSVASGSGAGISCSRTIVANTQEPVNVTQPATTYSCPAGTSGTPVAGGTCTRPGTATETAPVNVFQGPTTYSCPAGTSGTPVAGGTCTMPGTATETAPVNVFQGPTTYSCPAGYTGNAVAGGVCTRPGTPIVTTEAPVCAANQTTLSPSGLCKAVSSFSGSTVPAGSSCPAGSATDAGTAPHADGSIKCFVATPPTTCASAGFAWNGTTCSMSTPTTESANVIANTPAPVYSCPAGYTGNAVAGGTCSRTVSAPTQVPVVPNTPARFTPARPVTPVTPLLVAPAPAPFLLRLRKQSSPTFPLRFTPARLVPLVPPVAGGTCTRPGTAQEAVASVSNTSYSCPAGFAASGSGAGTTCSKTVATSTPVAAVSNTTYSCAAGYQGSGSGAGLTCSKTVAIDPLITCKNGSAPQDAGSGQNVCIVGAASTTSATVKYCAKGVLSADKMKCVLSAGSSSSIAPAFTG